eukprot:15455786-Alexandrium_andersonii.AAC.1
MTEALTSPGVAPAANKAQMRSGASRGSGDARTLRLSDPSWGPAPSVSMKFKRKLISSSTSSVFASGTSGSP